MTVLNLFLTVAWTIEIVANEEFTYAPVIALDSCANPYILIAKSYYLFLYAKVNGNWLPDTFETNYYELSTHRPDLAIDTKNRVWCIYPVIDTINRVMYLIVARKDSTGWIKDTLEFSPHLDFYTYSITTNLDTPHITYDIEYERVACYAVLSDSVWRKTIFDTVGFWGNYSGFSMVFREKPHISYMHFFPNGRGELWYAKKLGSIWVKEKLDTLFADFLTSFSSIAVGPNDFASIAYVQQHPLGENPTVQYAYYDGALWHIDKVETLSWFSSPKVLDVDSSGTPYLLYRRLEASDRKDRIAYKDSLGWHKEILPFTPGTSWSWGGSLRVDHNGLIHIARYATDYNDSIHELHYIYGTPEGIEEDNKSQKLKPKNLKIQILPNIIGDNAQLKYIIPDKQRIKLNLYDIAGRKVAMITEGTVEPGVHSCNFDSANLSSGVYFLILEGEKEIKREKVFIVR